MFYDEIDLLPGKVRVKRGGGIGGHNGIRCSTRISGRISGACASASAIRAHKDLVQRYVLHDFAKAEAPGSTPLLDAIAAEAAPLVAGDETAS